MVYATCGYVNVISLILNISQQMSFVVVEFLDEGAVEVVHKSWIMKKENVSLP